MKKNIGFIGFGNMSKAMANGIANSNLEIEDIIISRIKSKDKKMIEKKYGYIAEEDNISVAKKSDYLFLGVPANKYKDVIKEIKDDIKDDCIVIAIAAGINSEFLKENLKDQTKYIRIMPNTPAMIGEGMTAMMINSSLSDKDIDNLKMILSTFGQVEIIDEELIHGFISIAGSSPAYIYILIEAMADAAVSQGISRDISYRLAAQSVIGSAKMVLETGIHPGILKDNVCSPGGTTIEAVNSLEETGFRNSIIKAMKICGEKSKELE